MNNVSISTLRSIEYSVPDLTKTSRFYEKIWKLEPVAQENGALYFRATGSEHHCVVLHMGATAGVKKINFGAKDKKTVDAIYQRLRGLKIHVSKAPTPLLTPGGGYGFSFRDPDGIAYEVASDVIQHKQSYMSNDRPFKLSHVVINSDRISQQTEWFCDALGFKLSDQTEIMNFIRCSSDHHSIALARSNGVSLNHTAWEMPDFNALMTGVGRLRHCGFEVDWGVGRHGPGNNIFSYFREPNGLVVEYTAEVEQVGEDYKAGTPEEWATRRRKNEMWGNADLPSTSMRKSMHGNLVPPKVEF